MNPPDKRVVRRREPAMMQGDGNMTRTQWTLILVALLMTTLPLLTGCDQQLTLHGQTPNAKPANLDRVDYVDDETVVDPDGDSARGATDVAMEWADKYAKATQELLYANKRIDDLENDKKKLQTQIASLKAELAGYQRELNDANAMLNDMKKDLKEWRANVLGIRKDFIASQNAILASQYRILELLGGEVSRTSRRPSLPAAGAQSSLENQQPNLVSLQGSSNP
jgi:hypothetical protein